MIPNEPEYSGFNTKKSSRKRKELEKVTRSMYLSLVGAKPLDPSTMMTAAIKAMEMTEWTGQAPTVVTCDQQLYKALVNIKWEVPEKFKNLIPRLGEMHLLMSFIGCCGPLMANAGTF